VLYVPDANDSSPFDEEFHLPSGLSPATKNIAKRRWRKRPNISKEEIKEAEAEILRLQRGGVYTDKAEIELIPVEEEDELFETPSGNTIVTMKEGPPIRAGIPSTFTDAELQMLPKHQLERISLQPPPQEEEEEDEELDAELEEELDKELAAEDENNEDEEEDGEPPKKKPRLEDGTTNTTTPTTTSTTDSALKAEDDKEQKISVAKPQPPPATLIMDDKRVRELRTQKVNIAMEIAQLQKKNEQNRIILTDEPNLRAKQRIAAKIAKFNEAINSKKQKMA